MPGEQRFSQGPHRRHRMRRLALVATLCLLLGGIINVVVAWGCVLWSPIGDRLSSHQVNWPLPAPATFPPKAHSLDGHSGPGVLHELYSYQGFARLTGVNPTSSSANFGHFQEQLFAGWPCLSLGLHRTRDFQVQTNPIVRPTLSDLPLAWHEGIVIPEWIPWMANRNTRALPTMPRWPGFLLNTLYHASLVGTAWWTPCAVRKALRRRRGACVHCGYALHGTAHAACPECGTDPEARR